MLKIKQIRRVLSLLVFAKYKNGFSMYLFGLIVGAFCFRGAFEINNLLNQPFYNWPLIFHKRSILTNYVRLASSPSFLIFVLAVNGYLIEGVPHIFIMPILAFLFNLPISIIARTFSKRTQWSFFLSPIVHVIVLSILLISLIIFNIF